MPLNAFQKKKKREKELAIKRRKEEERRKRQENLSAEEKQKLEESKNRRGKQQAFVQVSVQNLDLASQVFTVKKAAIFVGNKANAQDQEHLTELGITHVINCAAEIPIPAFYAECNIQSLHLAMTDMVAYPIEEHFEETCAWIQENLKGKNKILVHCQQGKSRSATIVLAYLIHHHNMRYMPALASVTARRHLIDPNSGFKNKLEAWELQHFPEEEATN